MKKSLVSMIAVLALAIGACGGDDDPAPIDSGGGGGIDSGGGGTPDSGGGGTPDGGGGATPSASSLGVVCDPAMAGSCPADNYCLTLAMGQPGFCSIICEGAMDMFTCSGANGFPGPGMGMCILQAAVDGVNTPFCGIGCGVQVGGDGMCPTGLTCGDADMNGQTDICVPM